MTRPARVLNGHLVVQTENPNQLRAVFPEVKEATIKGQKVCAVPHTLEAAKILNNIGIAAPSPIRAQYDWPGIYTPRWYQVDTAEFFTLNPRAHCHNAMRCVDGETEFLTPSGWKRIDQYVEGDLVAQWTEATDRAEFVEPLEYIDTPCDEMIHIKTSCGIDQMLTANHRVPYYSAGPNKKFRETTAGEIHSRNQITRGWTGKLPVTFNAPECEGLPLTDAEIRVMVMLIADGYFPSPSTSRCQVRIKKERKKERIRVLLATARIEFSERSKDYPSAQGFTIFTFTAPRREKEFGVFWWGATEAQLKIIIDEVQHWDSTPRRADAFSFSTAIERSADFIQYAAVATKRVAALKCTTRERRRKVEKEYIVYVRGHGKPLGIINGTTGAPNTKIVPSVTGRCYCFSVPSTYIIFRRRGCVFVSGNTGKTLSALWAADYLRRAGYINRTLIVAPLSTLWDVWEQNIFESFPLRTFCVLHGTRTKRLELLAKPHDFYIVNHHGVNIIEEALEDREDIDMVIIDEVAVFRSAKNKKGVLWAPLNNVLNRQGIARNAWGLTGTPTPNDPTDAFGQCKLITPENYRSHFTAFKNETMYQLSQFRWIPRKDSAQTVARVLKPSIRFERSVCATMKPCFIERRAELSTEQAQHYKALMDTAVTEIRGSTVTAVNAAVLIQKLVQTACGCVYDANGAFIKLDFGPRLKVLEDLVEQNNEKVLVFVPFTGALEAVAAALRKRWSVAIVDGNVSTGKRTTIFRDFRNSKDPHILVCHPGTMAHGLDLTAASLSIWYAPYWRAEIYQQANARTDGSKQQSKIDIAHIYATAEERKIYNALKEKGRMQDVVLGMS
jgi:hypothetical protein